MSSSSTPPFDHPPTPEMLALARSHLLLSPSTPTTYYDLLSLSSSSTPAQIKLMWRALCLELHPDKKQIVTPSSPDTSTLSLSRMSASLNDIDGDDDDVITSIETPTNTTTANSASTVPDDPPAIKPSHSNLHPNLTFQSLTEAYKCLSTPSTKLDYDAALHHVTIHDFEITDSTSSIIVDATVSLGDMKTSSIPLEDDENESELMYAYDCRCGEAFELYEGDLIDHCDDGEDVILECSRCGLKILIKIPPKAQLKGIE